VDTGASLATVPVDHEGRIRPAGSTLDVGAYELG
jgi:hypothetical protein